MNFKKWLATVLVASCTSLICFTVQAKPILGLVELDKTTKSELQKNVEKRGCSCSRNGNTISVSRGCFSLPGEATVSVYFYSDADRAYAVSLKYTKGMGNNVFSSYVNSLKKSYGQPGTLDNAFVGDRYALWKKKDIVIELTEPHMSFDGELFYIVRDVWNRIQKRNEEKQKKANKDSEML